YRGAVLGGMRSMMKTALERVHNGQTTLQEVERVLGGVHEDLAGTTAGAGLGDVERRSRGRSAGGDYTENLARPA
ncbi:MAG TPA: hypothetical protein VFZ73_01555, partial [Gemmatimonadaceae bacterium]